MRLLSLRVHHLPGIDRGFEVDALSPGINVVVGPNASGKSSLLRAVRALLYGEEAKGEGVIVEGVFEDGAGRLTASRVADAVTWSRDGERVDRPPLPGRHLIDCYTLRLEDLTRAADVDRPIVERLRQDLAGGYDVQAVLAAPPFHLKANHGRSEAKRLSDAERELNGVRGRRQELRDQERQIAEWRRHEAAADAARSNAEDHRRALALLLARRKARALQEALEPFPADMARLVGDEGRRLERLQEAEQAHLQALSDARRRASQAAGQLAASGLDASELQRADLDERVAQVRELRGWEDEVAKHRDAAARAGAALERALATLRAPPDHLGGDVAPAAPIDVGELHLDAGTLHAVEGALAERRAADATIRALEQELSMLPDPDAAGPDATRLRAGRNALLDFLAASHAGRPSAWQLASAALVVGGAAAALTWLARSGAGWQSLAPAAAAILAGVVASLAQRRGGRERSGARAAFRRSGLEPPESWAPEPVQRTLADLDEALSAAELLARRRERREQVERQLQSERERLEGIDSRLADEATRYGFDPRHLDAGFHRWLRLLDEAERAGRELSEARGASAPLQEAVDGRRRELVAFLSAHGEPPDAPSPGAAVLEARLAALQTRLTRRNDAERDAERARNDESRALEELGRARRDVTALLLGAGLLAGPAEPGGEGPPGAGTQAVARAGASDDDATREAVLELRRRLERLPEYRARQAELEAAVAEERLRAHDVEGRPDLVAAVADDDEAGLERRRHELEQEAAGGRAFTERIAQTLARVHDAEQDRALTRATAERQDAGNALGDRLREAFHAEAGRLLLGAAETSYRRDSEPPALARASSWFRRFTHGQFELRFDARSEAFAAFDTASERARSLEQLSTGTRAQLLLAVRIAFAVQAEEGRTPLPLFLDEALTTADADRFREVVRSLRMLASEGRQLFYLTARPEDAQLWQAQDAAAGTEANGAGPERTTADAARVTLVDMARVRALDAAVTDPQLLAAPAAPTIPEPDGLEPGAYAVALGVPAIDPWAPAGSCHLFHLLRDDLRLVRRLLQADVARLGPLRSFLASEAASALLAPAERALLRRRADGAAAYLAAWRHGRGRPVDRAALDASGVLTDKMLGPVATLAAQVHGDARALLEGLENKRVAKFQSAKRRDLADWLAGHGYLDDRPPLPDGELRQRVFDALVAASEDAEATALLEEARGLASWLEAGLRAGREAASETGGGDETGTGAAEAGAREPG